MQSYGAKAAGGRRLRGVGGLWSSPLSQKMQLEAVGELHQVHQEDVFLIELQLIRVGPAQHRHGDLRLGIYTANERIVFADWL